MFQALVEQSQNNHISEWLHGLGDVGVALMLMYFRWSAKRDTTKRHEENKNAQKAVIENQEKVLQELQTEREYLPQHWHGEFGDKGVVLTSDGIIRKPYDGKTNR